MSEAIEERSIPVEESSHISTPTEMQDRPGTLRSPQDLSNDYRLDYHDDGDSGHYSNLSGKSGWSNPYDYNDGYSSGVRSARYRDHYGSPDVEGYGNLYSNSRRRTFSPSRNDSLLGAERDLELLSPRSRYDLPGGPSRATYASQWDNQDEFSATYDPISPRYKMDSGRWGDHELGPLYDDSDRMFSPRDRTLLGNLNYQSEMDSYPSSYTYGMRHANKYNYAMPAHSGYPRTNSSIPSGDYMNDDLEESRMNDSHLYPFSDPSSPQPMYGYRGESNSNDMIHPMPLRSLPYTHSIRMKYSSPQPDHVTHAQGKREARSAATATTPVTPQSPASHNSSNGPSASLNEGSTSNDDAQYRIDSQTIMQNLEERTVVIIRNIPNRYKLEDLQKVIRSFVDGEGERCC